MAAFVKVQKDLLHITGSGWIGTTDAIQSINTILGLGYCSIASHRGEKNFQM